MSTHLCPLCSRYRVVVYLFWMLFSCYFKCICPFSCFQKKGGKIGGIYTFLRQKARQSYQSSYANLFTFYVNWRFSTAPTLVGHCIYPIGQMYGICFSLIVVVSIPSLSYSTAAQMFDLNRPIYSFFCIGSAFL